MRLSGIPGPFYPEPALLAPWDLSEAVFLPEAACFLQPHFSKLTLTSLTCCTSWTSPTGPCLSLNRALGWLTVAFLSVQRGLPTSFPRPGPAFALGQGRPKRAFRVAAVSSRPSPAWPPGHMPGLHPLLTGSQLCPPAAVPALPQAPMLRALGGPFFPPLLSDQTSHAAMGGRGLTNRS